MSNLPLKKKREVGGFAVLPKERPPFLHGDKVRVTEGAFNGHIGIFADMKPHERVSVLLSMLGGSVAVEMARAAIRPV